MTIKTFFSKGDQWSQITAGSTATQNNAVFTTWDPSQIKWNDVTTVPANINITYPGTTVPGITSAPGTTWIGDPMTIPNWDPNKMIGGCQNNGWSNNTYDWNTAFNWVDQYAFQKPAGVRPDVLMGFFSKYVHALLFVTETSSYVVPFMERVGAIWLQKGPNKWIAYDKKEFYDFIDNPDVLVFTGTELNKREMQKTLADSAGNSENEDDE